MALIFQGIDTVRTVEHEQPSSILGVEPVLYRENAALDADVFPS